MLNHLFFCVLCSFVKKFREAQDMPKYRQKMKKYREFTEYIKNATKITSRRTFAAGIIFYNLHCVVSTGNLL